MSRIDPPERRGDLEERLIDRLEETHGFVPNQHLLDLHLPLVLESLLDLNRRVVFEGDLDHVFLEKLALLISADNGCDYCISYHSNNYAALLERRGAPTEEVEALRRGDWRDAEFTEREAALVELALAANRDPSGVTDRDVQDTLDAGASERDLVQLVHFVTLIEGYNRFNTVFDTDVDDEMGGWLAAAQDAEEP